MHYSDIDTAAREAFGIPSLYPLQKKVIQQILAGKRQIVLFPTGYGKSICFLLPALMLGGATLVIYPLLALVKDQKRRMEKAGIPAVVLQGGQTHEQRARVFAAVREKRAKVVLATPEILQNPRVLSELSRCPISHIAIDEAHCVSEWGESFRPAYLELGSIIDRLGVQCVTAFTATASPRILAHMKSLLFSGTPDDVTVVQGSFDRPNLHYRVVATSAKMQALFSLVLTLPKPLIVFCGTRDGAEDTARALTAFFSLRAQRGATAFPVRFYHAGLSKTEKETIERWFYDSTDGILCSTCAYGMGVDKADIRSCIHKDPPQKIEFFIQETGRSGRDGKQAQTVLLWAKKDRRKARALQAYAEGKQCRRHFLVDYLHKGEALTCSGCDICDHTPPEPDTASLVIEQWVRKNRRLYTESDAVPELAALLNAHAYEATGCATWEAASVLALLSDLYDARRIRLVGLGKKENARLDIVRSKRSSKRFTILPLQRLRLRLTHRLRLRYRQLVRAAERQRSF